MNPEGQVADACRNFLFTAILIAVFSDAIGDGRCLMPSSQIANISTITGWIAEIQPASILDVGVGFGKYGVLAREYTDVRAGRYRRGEWKVTIDGIEIYSPYYNPIWKSTTGFIARMWLRFCRT